jgi:hypothetical protein
LIDQFTIDDRYLMLINIPEHVNICSHWKNSLLKALVPLDKSGINTILYVPFPVWSQRGNYRSKTIHVTSDGIPGQTYVFKS